MRCALLGSIVLASCGSFGTTPSDGGAAIRSDAGVDGNATPGGLAVGYAAVVLADEPLAYWRFGETTGAIARSEVNSPERDAEIGGSPTRGRPGAIEGDPNTAFEFVGQSTQYVTAKDQFDFRGREPFSLETWLLVTRIDGAYRHVFVKDYANNTDIRQEYGVYVQQNNGLAFERIVAGVKIQIQTGITVGSWSHVVATYDGSRIRLYLNGTLAAVDDDDRAQATKTEPFYMGRKGQSDGPLYGAMDEVAVYGKALGPDRVAAHYAAGIER
jgi:hypothetical protein